MPAVSLRLSGVVCFICATSVSGKFNLFSRFLQSSSGDSTATTTTMTKETLTSATEKVGNNLMGLVIPDYDPWKEDKFLQWADRIKSGDHLGSFADMLSTSELDKIWGDSETAHLIVNSSPVLQQITGLGHFARRRLEDLGPDDGKDALQVFRDFLDSTAKGLDLMTNPQKYGDMFKRWANSDDPEVTQLWDRIEKGDARAMFDLQNKIYGAEVGNHVSLSSLGFNGEVPQLLRDMADKLNNDEDNVMEDLVLTHDRENAEWITNPLKAMEQAMEFAGVSFDALQGKE